MSQFSKGSRLATVTQNAGRFDVWVGFGDGAGGTIPARFFKRHTTCSNDYGTEAAALRAVRRFLDAK